MPQKEKHIDTSGNAWSEPISLAFRRTLEKARKGQPSLIKADERHEIGPTKLRIDKTQRGEAQAGQSLQPQTETIDVEAVACRVYRMMKTDLILEKERTSKPGG